MTTPGQRRQPQLSPIGLLFAAAMTIAGAVPASAANDDVSVVIDQAKLVPLDRPAAEIIVGNPSIADVAVETGKLLVVTGKSYGRTNLIVIDADGKEVINKYLSVTEPGKGYVMMHKGAAAQYTYYCAPNCTPSLTVGDFPANFEAVSKQIQAKQSMGQSQAEGGGPGQ
jgi:Flp pilus assembly secretin CpaC